MSIYCDHLKQKSCKQGKINGARWRPKNETFLVDQVDSSSSSFWLCTQLSGTKPRSDELRW